MLTNFANLIVFLNQVNVHIVAVFFSVTCMDLFLFIANLLFYFWYQVTTIIRCLTRTLSSNTFLAFVSATV